MFFLDPKITKFVLLFAGVTLILITSGAFWSDRFVRHKKSEYFMPMIRQEWARRAEDMGAETGLGGLWLDSLLFIPMYVWVFYILASHLQTSAKAGNGSFLFYAIMICTVVAALADELENYFIYKVSHVEASPLFFTSKYYACYIKWLLIGVAVLLTSWGFLAERNAWVGIPGLINAALLIYGTVADHALIQWGFGMLGALLLIIFLLL